jgi:NADPH2:quinone reductase
LIALGAKVIATAGSAEKLRVCKEKGGADFALDYTKPDWQKEVLKITGGKGANVIYDPVGMIQPSLKCIAWNGRAVVVGFAAGSIEKVCVYVKPLVLISYDSDLSRHIIPQIPMNLVLLKNISLVGVHWVRLQSHSA